MSKVVIHIEGGLVQEVETDDQNLELMILDYDIDGADEDGIVQYNGTKVYPMFPYSVGVQISEESRKLFDDD